MVAWHGGARVGFDLGTTGTERGEFRIAAAAVSGVRGGEDASPVSPGAVRSRPEADAGTAAA
ncbi:hypothetical protein [Streptomyces sp. NPDC001568]|uniref:hypothetical protein n=1 Tax=Streptomyces sp. NPDC001568 TaxID=3364588 RepID=UPI0036CC48A4